MEIKFNKKIYNLKAVKSTIRAYRGLADFDFKQKGAYIKVELKNINKDVEKIIKDEFCNYVLFSMKL